MKKVGKTTRQFIYDLNQISYDCTVEMTNRFKGLNLGVGMPEELWMEVHVIAQEVMTKTMPKQKKCKKAQWLPEKTLQIAEKRSERQKRKGKIYQTECRIPENSRGR